jgi:hypothetical protein
MEGFDPKTSFRAGRVPQDPGMGAFGLRLDHCLG